MELVVLDKQGKDTGRKVTLSESIYGLEPSQHTVYLEVKRYLAAQRQGTHKSKERAEIKGSTRKIKKQKGTGTARAGSIKNPLFKGGGRVFGPRPRKYILKINKQQKRLAKRSVLSDKFKNNNILVLEEISYDKPKTKEFINLISSLELTNKKSLFVLPESNKNVYLSSRNLKKVKVVNHSELNIYDLINSSKVILFEGAVKQIEETLSHE